METVDGKWEGGRPRVQTANLVMEKNEKGRNRGRNWVRM